MSRLLQERRAGRQKQASSEEQLDGTRPMGWVGEHLTSLARRASVAVNFLPANSISEDRAGPMMAGRVYDAHATGVSPMAAGGVENVAAWEQNTKSHRPSMVTATPMAGPLICTATREVEEWGDAKTMPAKEIPTATGVPGGPVGGTGVVGCCCYRNLVVGYKQCF